MKIISSIKLLIKNNKLLYYPIQLWNTILSNKRVKKFHRVGYSLNQEIDSILTNLGINYTIAFGNLLGIIRDKAFIAYDDDLDYLVFINQSIDWSNVIYNMKKKGFKVKHMFSNKEIISEVSFEKYGIQIDFFAFVSNSSNRYVYGYYRTNNIVYGYDEVSTAILNMPYIEETKRIEVKGYSFMIPLNYDQVLERSYGDSWRVPQKGVHHSPYLEKYDKLISYKLICK